jgi:hypothetical protein
MEDLPFRTLAHLGVTKSVYIIRKCFVYPLYSFLLVLSWRRDQKPDRGAEPRQGTGGSRGRGRNERITPLENSLRPKTGRKCLLQLASAACLGAPSRGLCLHKAAQLEPSTSNPALSRRYRPAKTLGKIYCGSRHCRLATALPEKRGICDPYYCTPITIIVFARILRIRSSYSGFPSSVGMSRPPASLSRSVLSPCSFFFANEQIYTAKNCPVRSLAWFCYKFGRHRSVLFLYLGAVTSGSFGSSKGQLVRNQQNGL